MKTMTLRTRMLAIASFFIAGGCFAQENFSWKELINETRINVSKLLNDLQNKGLLQLKRKEIFILDKKIICEN